MKRLVYILLILLCLSGQTRGTVLTDSLLHQYSLVLEANESPEIYKYAVRMVNLIGHTQDTAIARKYLQKLRQFMKRTDIPFVNLIEGDIWMQLHQPDSALKHYRVAADGNNLHLAALAYERMGAWSEANRQPDQAFQLYHKAMDRKASLISSVFLEKEEYDYAQLQRENQLNKLKVERQQYFILILLLSAFIILMAGGITIYYFYRKNQTLKQQEELNSLRVKEAVLREKDAMLREELLKRIHVADKLQEDGHINLSDADWKDIRLMLDSTYPDFTRKLQSNFPTLTEKDINFCCLVKINMNLQSLANIYCISGNSVSRRKLRLKEKLGIDKDESLSKFLSRFA